MKNFYDTNAAPVRLPLGNGYALQQEDTVEVRQVIDLIQCVFSFGDLRVTGTEQHVNRLIMGHYAMLQRQDRFALCRYVMNRVVFTASISLAAAFGWDPELAKWLSFLID